MVRTVCVSLGFVVTLAGARAAQAAESVPTFTKDVAPILFAKCVSCHRPGEVAPMSLLTYEQVRPWAKALRSKVTSREMPPWGADPRFGKFANDNTLTDDQIKTISAWVEGGTPRGNDADMPKPPAIFNGWSAAAAAGSEPDYVIEMMAPFKVPAEGELPNLNFYAPIPFKEDRFTRLLEARPGNRSLVHHFTVQVTDLPEGARLDEGGELIYADGTRQNDPNRPRRRPGQQPRLRLNDKQIVDYVPGRSAIPSHSPGIGFRIPAGKYINFGIHYQPTGRPETDQSKVGMWFTKNNAVQELYRESVGTPLPTSLDKTEFYRVEGKPEQFNRGVTFGRHEDNWPPLAPFVENYTVVGATAIIEPITLYGFTPHMHLRGKDMRWVLTLPDGSEETLLNIPKYDFNWQTYYELQQPRKIPAGSTITNVAHYSNSPRNKYNPAPDKEVYWSEQSWDEMYLPYITYTIDSENPNAKGATRAPTRQR
ncbi:MAG TPA: cytochrome c [Vicinamibacterales bacterium]|jgi:hypothetical protein